MLECAILPAGLARVSRAGKAGDATSEVCMRRSLALLLPALTLVLAPAGARADEDISDVYPTYIERMILFWTNVARMDISTMPTPAEDPEYADQWVLPPGGEFECPPLVYQRDLGESARYHAQDMADKDYFAHESLDGSSPFDRMQRFGYSGAVMGENIAMGQPTAQEVVEGWMTSPGHRHNILLCCYEANGIDYEELGTGFGRPANNPAQRYWVQNFGAGSQDEFIIPALPAGIGWRKNNKQAHFGVGYYDPLEKTPEVVQLVFGEVCHPMTRESGKAWMGTYAVEILLPQTGAQEVPYYFQAKDADGYIYYYPESGSLQLRTAPASDDRVATKLAPACATAVDPDLRPVGEGEGEGGEGEGEGGEGEGEGGSGGDVNDGGRERGGGCVTASGSAGAGWAGGGWLALLAGLLLLTGRRARG